MLITTIITIVTINNYSWIGIIVIYSYYWSNQVDFLPDQQSRWTCPRRLWPVPARSIRVHVDETTQLGCEGVPWVVALVALLALMALVAVDQLWIPSGEHTKSYWTWPFIVDFPTKNGDLPWQNVSSPEGRKKHLEMILITSQMLTKKCRSSAGSAMASRSRPCHG